MSYNTEQGSRLQLILRHRVGNLIKHSLRESQLITLDLEQFDATVGNIYVAGNYMLLCH